MASLVQGANMSTVGSRATGSSGVSTTGYQSTSRGQRAPSQTVPMISLSRALPGSSSPQVNFRQIANSSSAMGYPTQGAAASGGPRALAASQANHVAPATPSRVNPFRSPLSVPEHSALPRSDLQRFPAGARMVATPGPTYREIAAPVPAVPSTPTVRARSPPMQSRILPQQAQTPQTQFRSPLVVSRNLALDEARQGISMPVGPSRANSKTRVAVGGPANHRTRRIVPVDPTSSFSMGVVMSPIPRARLLHSPHSPMVPTRVIRSADVSLVSPFPRYEGIERSMERSVERKGKTRMVGGMTVKDRGDAEDDEMQQSIETAMALLPASPPNTLAIFLAAVAAHELKPAGVHTEAETCIDAGRFWENRRVQNSLRRLLESLQERYDIMQQDELTRRAFDDLLRRAQFYHGRPLGSNLNEVNFSKALADLSLWPPELSDGDRKEAFLALTVPNAHAVEHVWNSGKMMEELNLRSFQEGLARVPYNLPDFPVPTGDLDPRYTSGSRSKPAKGKTREVCMMIANVFSDPKTGLEKVKDYFLCGLVSCEEIQMSLDVLVPVALVDEAILRIIRASAKYVRKADWRILVDSVRRNPDFNDAQPEASSTLRESTTETLAEPQSEPTVDLSPQDDIDMHMQHRPIAVEPPTNWGVRITTEEPPSNLSAISAATAEEPSGGSFEEFTSTSRTLAAGAQTEPMPTRELLNEEAVVNFCSPGVQRRICDWSTSQHRTLAETIGSASERPGNADEGAGTPQHNRSYLTDEPSEIEGSLCQSTGRRALSGEDPVAWVSLEMQNECYGPYLSRAFQKCCLIYQARSGTRGFDDDP